MSPGKRRQGGFTLLELLAATVLMALGLAVLMSALGDAMRYQTSAGIRNHLAQVARSMMAERSLQTLQPGSEEGLREGVHWRLECSLRDRSPGIGLYHAVLTLRQGKYEGRFVTLRLQRLAQAGTP
ncbi:MAG: type II secretion system GspH family protein [Paucimonas sp.]|jgi:general secretion pathway protein I|nr:type II secretion system GspH family protein [Paucimonas sp.]